MAWTKSQEEVLNSTGAVIVSASAGTGKTAVLTEKVVKLLLSRTVTIDQMLIMTFSNNAAAEMKERIKNKLFSALYDKTSLPEERKAAYDALTNLNRASIQTVHSFCYDIIKRYAVRFGLDPSVKIADDATAYPLKWAAAEEIFENEYNEPGFREVEQYLSIFSEADPKAEIIKVMDRIYGTCPNLDEWANRAVNSYSTMPDMVLDYLMDSVDEISQFTSKALDLAKQAQLRDDKFSKVVAGLSNDIDALNSIWEAVLEGNLSKTSSFIPQYGETIRFPQSEFSDEIKAVRKEAKSLFDKVFKGLDMDDQVQRMHAVQPLVEGLVNIIGDIHERYERLKFENALIDFHDLEMYAIKMLSDNQISQHYKDYYKRVFVDEYQDTSPIQETIIEKVSYPENLFCVGDVKQSIYGFRSSEPALFNQRRNSYRKGNGKVISLSQNFRSKKNILDCTNDVFTAISSNSAELSYNQSDRLIAGTDQQSESVSTEINLIQQHVFEAYPDISEKKIEVFNLVAQVKKAMQGTIMDGKNIRPVKYSDIAILVRNLVGISAVVTEIFTANKIPFVIEKSGSLLDTMEISLLIDVLCLISNQKDDIRIASVIHNRLLGLDDTDLLNIRKCSPDRSLYDNMQELSGYNTELGNKCRLFFDILEGYEKKQYNMPLSELVRQIISELCLKDYVATFISGQQALANLDEFVKFVENYEKNSSQKVYGLLNQIHCLKNAGVVIAEGNTEQEPNRVVVTTIHKSKGLEYPIVIVPFAGKKFGVKRKDAIIVDSKAGLGVQYFKLDTLEKGRCILKDAADYMVSKRSKEEEMRLLYVAMTRAKNKLIIAAKEPSLCGLSASNSYIEWILAAVIDDRGRLKTDLSGEWEITYTQPQNIDGYILSNNGISKDEFLSQFKISANYVEVTIGDRNSSAEPVCISSSQLDSLQTVAQFNLPTLSEDNSALQKGTAFHKFMRLVEISKTVGVNVHGAIYEELERMVKTRKLTKEDQKLVSTSQLLRLFNTQEWKSVVFADEIKREIHFSYISPDKTLINCVIDLLYRVGTDWYIIDYKTDHFVTKTSDEILAHNKLHEAQLTTYKLALEDYGYKVKGTYIAYVDIGQIVKL